LGIASDGNTATVLSPGEAEMGEEMLCKSEASRILRVGWNSIDNWMKRQRVHRARFQVAQADLEAVVTAADLENLDRRLSDSAIFRKAEARQLLVEQWRRAARETAALGDDAKSRQIMDAAEVLEISLAVAWRARKSWNGVEAPRRGAILAGRLLIVSDQMAAVARRLAAIVGLETTAEGSAGTAGRGA
jgi:hypothetical protein